MANEYAVNQTDLVSVANAIRAKAEMSANLSFPNDFVSVILNNLSILPGALEAINAGEITLTSGNSSGLSVEHGLSVTPNFYMFVRMLKKGGGFEVFYALKRYTNKNTYTSQTYTCRIYQSNDSSSYTTTSGSSFSANSTTISCELYALAATYKWIAGKMALDI